MNFDKFNFTQGIQKALLIFLIVWMKKLWLYAPIRLHSRKRKKSWDVEIMKFNMNLEYSKKPRRNTFVSTGCKKFLWTLRTCSMYLKNPSNLVLCVSEKIVILRYTTQIILKEIWKKLGFWKNEAQMCSEYSDKTKCFEPKLLFQRTVKNFLCALRTCSRYLDGSHNIVFCVSEKIGLVRHFNQNISEKS